MASYTGQQRQRTSLLCSNKWSIFGAQLFGGCPGVPVHRGIAIVFISIHGVVTQFVNVSFLCVPVHEDTTTFRIKRKKVPLLLEAISYLGEAGQKSLRLKCSGKLWASKFHIKFHPTLSSLVKTDSF